ncbi:MAG: hypothetical protein ACLRWQ_23285 [Flavonifractor plautii]
MPYGPFTLDPSAMVFHYAQEVFEGLKAYRSRRRHRPALPPHRQRPPASTPPVSVMCIPHPGGGLSGSGH